MFKLDFIDAAAAGYRFTIIEHQTIYNLALIPFLVKWASFILITMMGLEDDYLKQGLILIPSFFVEGWLIAQLLRLAMLGERWPSVLSGHQNEDANLYQERAVCLKASMAVYVLIKLVTAAMAGVSLQASTQMEQAQQQGAAGDPIYMLYAIVIFTTMLWMFRLLWLHIPMALGQKIDDFLKSIKPFSSSIYMFGTWVLCVIPVAFLLLTLSEGVAYVFGVDPGTEVQPIFYKYVVVTMQAVLELFTAIVASVAMAYTIATIANPKKDKSK